MCEHSCVMHNNPCNTVMVYLGQMIWYQDRPLSCHMHQWASMINDSLSLIP